MKTSNSYWFKRRRYGYGWIPFTWQGWLTLALYLIVITSAGIAFLDTPETTRSREIGLFIMIFLVATISLAQICYRKGPKPHWRWGKRPGDNPEEDY